MNKREFRKNKQYHPRVLQGKEMRQSIIIYCEGETEVGYFSSFKKKAKCLRSGNALTVVQAAVAQKKASKVPFDQYWVVFDKDDSTNGQFIQAISLAVANEIQVAWSNQAFELWIVLHFRSFNQSCSRDLYEQVIRQHIPNYRAKEKGEEQGRRLYRQTSHLLDTAIKNALKDYMSFGPTAEESEKESSTRVYHLIEEILKNS